MLHEQQEVVSYTGVIGSLGCFWVPKLRAPEEREYPKEELSREERRMIISPTGEPCQALLDSSLNRPQEA